MHQFLQAIHLGTREAGGHQHGRVVDLRGATDKVLFLIGDVHARCSRIEDIFAHAQLHKLLQQDKAVVVFLGDLVHREEDSQAHEMETSLQTWQMFRDLKERYPRGIYALLGNHEFTRTDNVKRGYFQGLLFRRRLEQEGLDQLYTEFIRHSPLVVVHPQCVGVHAGPALSLQSWEQLVDLPVDDVHHKQMEPALRELAFFRHRSWAPQESKSYTDFDVDDFLQFCQVPSARLITGHTPLQRECGWSWDLGPRTTVIFAAGRECGYLQAEADKLRFVRVGRSARASEDALELDQSRGDLNWKWENGWPYLPLEAGQELLPDVAYRWQAPTAPVSLLGLGLDLTICAFPHLKLPEMASDSRAFYLVGRESFSEVLQLRENWSILLGGSVSPHGVRFAWDRREMGRLHQRQPGEFELMAFRPGLKLVW